MVGVGVPVGVMVGAGVDVIVFVEVDVGVFVDVGVVQGFFMVDKGALRRGRVAIEDFLTVGRSVDGMRYGAPN